jgi:prolyl-tRNA editing enzyme YbaK/EbsC (Cys-tRNA(Pro) deacylase)
LPTLVDVSLERFDTVWCAGGTPHAVFEVGTADLIGALDGPTVTEVS